MMPLASNGRLVTIGDKIRFPDDVTLGFIVEYLLKVPLTVVDSFHSHLERMDRIDVESFRDQVMALLAVDMMTIIMSIKNFFSLVHRSRSATRILKTTGML